MRDDHSPTAVHPANSSTHARDDHGSFPARQRDTGMEHVTIADVPNSVQPAAVMRPLTEPLGCTDVAINYYELAAGDSFAFAYHAHEVQEELFLVLAGTATWETDDGLVTVEAGEAIRFGTDEFQRGWNTGDERIRAFAVGAPLSYGDQPKRADCPACDGREPVEITRPADDDEAVVTLCRSCGTEVGRWVRGDDGENHRVVPASDDQQPGPSDSPGE